MKKILIAALSANGKIAREDGESSLNWTSKEDTQYFIQKTKEAKNLITGRKTFETINKPLKGRTIYVLPDQGDKPRLLSPATHPAQLESNAGSSRDPPQRTDSMLRHSFIFIQTRSGSSGILDVRVCGWPQGVGDIPRAKGQPDQGRCSP